MRQIPYTAVVLLAGLSVIGCGARQQPGLTLPVESHPADVLTLAFNVISSRGLKPDALDIVRNDPGVPQ